MRVSRHVFSEVFNPWMAGVAVAAKKVRRDRLPVSGDNPYLEHEKDVIRGVSEMIESTRKLRDQTCEQAFTQLYG